VRRGRAAFVTEVA